LAWTQTDLDAVEQALATGALRVRYADGREVTYRSQDDLRSLRRELRRTLGYVDAPRVVVAEHRR
jgi:hypothetical protein